MNFIAFLFCVILICFVGICPNMMQKGERKLKPLTRNQTKKKKKILKKKKKNFFPLFTEAWHGPC
jgi:hypothetical protein